MTKIKPSDIKLELEGEQYTHSRSDNNKPMWTCLKKKDINQRLSELLNILEEPIDDIEIKYKPKHDMSIAYKEGVEDGFKLGEEAHKKKTREVFLGR